MAFPDYVTIWPEGAKSVDTAAKTRFTWSAAQRALSVEPKASPELLLELASTGAIDGLRSLSIPEWAKAFAAFPALPGQVAETLEELRIESASLQDWSGMPALGALRRLRVGPKVKSIPDGALPAGLTRLELHAKTAALPSDLTALSQLAHLELVGSPITELPEALGALPLEELHLNGTTKLKALPESLGACTSLRVLRTVQVPLKALPDGVYTLPKLERLLLESSKLAKLGPRIDWPAMRVLDLQGSYPRWPAEVSMPLLEEASLGQRFSRLPDLFTSSLKRLSVNAPLEEVDPRFAAIPSQARGHGLAALGVALSCTRAAYAALAPAAREAFGSRLKAAW